MVAAYISGGDGIPSPLQGAPCKFTWKMNNGQNQNNNLVKTKLCILIVQSVLASTHVMIPCQGNGTSSTAIRGFSSCPLTGT
jgi:hypothetical protein